jgi:hypothetical protein
LAITKSIENGLITFGQKEIVLKRFKKLWITWIRNLFCRGKYGDEWTNYYSKEENAIKPDRIVVVKKQGFARIIKQEYTT